MLLNVRPPTNQPDAPVVVLSAWGVSKGGVPGTGASSMRVIAECGCSPLLVNGHLNGCGLGLVVTEQDLLLTMRTCRQADYHGALADVVS